jgi:dihydroorotate dehydrogenase (fumarate)
MGLDVSSPLVASASALSKKLDHIKQMEDAGLGAVVLYSLFEEEITHESLALNHYLVRGTDSFAEAMTYFPDLGQYNTGPEKYLELISQAKKAVGMPVIGSLNGVTSGGWIKYAKMMQEAGADALELNMYFLPTDPRLSAEEVEKEQIELVTQVRKSIKIPLAVKLSPFYTSLPNFARALSQAGANALVLFNRFFQPTLDIESLEVVPWLELSDSADLLLPLRWIAILFDRMPLQYALTSGVHSGEDAVKALMVGAQVAMTASALVRGGIGAAEGILAELNDWMDEHEYQSVDQMRGSLSQKSVAEPAAFERANYMKALTLYDNRIMYTG